MSDYIEKYYGFKPSSLEHLEILQLATLNERKNMLSSKGRIEFYGLWKKYKEVLGLGERE